MREIWKPVVGFEGLYEVSNRARIRSLKQNPALVMKAKPNSEYKEVKLRRNGQSVMKYVHLAMLEAFVGRCPNGMECRHLNGNPRDNRLSNLAWGTHAQNTGDSIRHGTFRRGERHGNAKLSNEVVRYIRASLKKQVELAEQFDVSQVTISRVKNGLRWKHVQC
jgi:hypothetical protein